MMRRTLSLLFFMLLGAPAFHAAARQPPDVRAALKKRIGNYSLHEENFLFALVGVAREFRVPMAIEWVRTPETLRDVTLSLGETDVRGIIVAILAGQTGYTFDIRNGYIHVFQPGLMKSPENFLNTRIDKFEVRHEPAGSADLRLQGVVNRIMAKQPSQPSGGDQTANFGGPLGDPDVTLDLEDVTVREALNRVTFDGGFMVWVVTFPPNHDMTSMGFLRTVTPNGKNVPDPSQPAWELLRWGQTPED